MRLNSAQVERLRSLSEDAREGELRALAAGERHRHDVEVRVAARSDLDGRLLFRWFCSCGGAVAGDYFAAADARAAADRHRGVAPEAPAVLGELRQCEAPGCEVRFAPTKFAPGKRFCSERCRNAARLATGRPRAQLFGMEDDDGDQ